MPCRANILAPLTCLLIGIIASSCSKVQYPNCENDSQCQAKGEYCVNKQCQQCREDSHCATGERCANGRCETKPECSTDAQCSDGKVCRLDKCVTVECTTNDDCGEGKICEADTCVSPRCSTDQECGSGMHCDNGQCAEGASNISSACRSSVPGEKVKLLTVNFDFDRSDLRIDARNTLEQNAECLKQAGGVQIVLEGHCDERGTQEYNLALGEKRAAAVTSYLKNLGVNTSNLRTVSKGKNEPVCQEESDSCHDRNRRVEFIQR